MKIFRIAIYPLSPAQQVCLGIDLEFATAFLAATAKDQAIEKVRAIRRGTDLDGRLAQVTPSGDPIAKVLGKAGILPDKRALFLVSRTAPVGTPWRVVRAAPFAAGVVGFITGTGDRLTFTRTWP